MNLRLSFIVPFFNVEPYIEECIRSLYAQDIPWEEYEVICVDDCSPDGSRAIVERLQKEYPTLKLLTTPENLRQGGARNVGLDVAQGRYIWFVDSDDYIQSNCLKKLLTLAEGENLDILDFDYDTDDIGKQYGLQKNTLPYTIDLCSGTEYVFDSRVKWAAKCGAVCGMIIKRDFLYNHNLYFVEKVQYEDTDFSMQMFYYAQRVKHIDDKLYVYRYVETSSTHSKITKSNILYRVEAIKRFVHLYNTNTLSTTQWRSALREIIKNDVYELLVTLRNASLDIQLYFYKNRLGKIETIHQYIGKKSRMALNSLLMLYIICAKK